VKIAIILNGLSLEKKDFYKVALPKLKARFNVQVFETHSKSDAVALASKAAVNVANDVNTLINQLVKVSYINIDVGRVDFMTDSPLHKSDKKDFRYFINEVDVGMGPEVVRKVLSSGRPLGSAVAYYQSILSTFISYKPYTLYAKSEQWEWQSKVRTFAIANGKYYGHGLCIAPDAKFDDGVFEVFAAGEVSVLDFILQSIPLKQGKRLEQKNVSYLKATMVELSADRPAPIEADGELLGWLPAKIQIIPKRLRLLQ